MNCCSNFFFNTVGRLVTTEYCRVADTRPNRVTEPSIGSALKKTHSIGYFEDFLCFYETIADRRTSNKVRTSNNGYKKADTVVPGKLTIKPVYGNVTYFQHERN